jgi:hypothetical protein
LALSLSPPSGSRFNSLNKCGILRARSPMDSLAKLGCMSGAPDQKKSDEHSRTGYQRTLSLQRRIHGQHWYPQGRATRSRAIQAQCYASCYEAQSSERLRRGLTGKRRNNEHSMSTFPLAPDCFSQKWIPSEEQSWMRDLTKRVFRDRAFFRASYFALHDSLRSTGPSWSEAVVLLSSIPGIGERAAIGILAEIGINMRASPVCGASGLVGWCLPRQS